MSVTYCGNCNGSLTVCSRCAKPWRTGKSNSHPRNQFGVDPCRKDGRKRVSCPNHAAAVFACDVCFSVVPRVTYELRDSWRNNFGEGNPLHRIEGTNLHACPPCVAAAAATREIALDQVLEARGASHYRDWLVEGDDLRQAKLAVESMGKALEKIQKERDAAVGVLSDADRESARITQFGERLRRLFDSGKVCCANGRMTRAPDVAHDRECVYAELLRDMLGPEETERQAQSARELVVARGNVQIYTAAHARSDRRVTYDELAPTYGVASPFGRALQTAARDDLLQVEAADRDIVVMRAASPIDIGELVYLWDSLTVVNSRGLLSARRPTEPGPPA